MEKIKALCQAAAKLEHDIGQIRVEIERAQSAISGADPLTEALRDLRQQKTDAVGNAFIEGKAPDVADIDRAIAKAEKDFEKARTTYEAATAAIGLLTPRLSLLQEEQEGAKAELKQAGAQFCWKKFRKAEDAYLVAMQMLHDSFTGMFAANWAAEHFIRNSALENSAIQRREVFRTVNGPAWAWFDNLGIEESKAIVAELRALGMPA